MGTLLIIKILVGGISLGGGYYMLKKMSASEDRKAEQLEYIQDTIEDRTEDDLADLKRGHLIRKLQKYNLDEGFTERLGKVHDIFEQKHYSHPRAHTFYNTMLPKLLKVKQANKKLSGMAEQTVSTQEMYEALNQWMDEIIENKIYAIEGEAEINAKVITLLTK